MPPFASVKNILFRFERELAGRRGFRFGFLCHSIFESRRRRVCFLQFHERGADEAALKSDARRKYFGDDGISGRIFRAVRALPFGVKFFTGCWFKLREADAARGVAAGVLIVADLLGEFRLAGARGGGVQRKCMIQNTRDDLHPLAFGAAQFFRLQPERAFFRVVHLGLELAEVAHLGRHAVGDFSGGGGGFFRVALGGFLHARPLVGGGGDLGGDAFQVLNFFGNFADGVNLNDFSRRLKIQKIRHAREQRAECDAAGGDINFRVRNRMRGLVNHSGGNGEQNGVRQQPRPFGAFPFGNFSHAASVRKFLHERKRIAVSARLIRRGRNHLRVRTCVIFNPVARGDKARHFRDWLDGVAAECWLKPTQRAGDARRLAAAAVAENFELVIAAGGDGTVNEVVNGLGDAPDGFVKTRFGVLPLGTVNVFARELKIPAHITDAWKMLQRGKEIQIDLPCAEFFADGKMERRFFIQMAGAGIDARAIELANWELKKKVGQLAYVVAGLRALAENKPVISVNVDGQKISGELVLVGNGKFYGGTLAIFPAADGTDGRLEICAVPRANFWTLLRAVPGLLLQKRLPEKIVRRLSAEKFTLTSETKAAFELDGEWVGHLPVTFSVGHEKLRVIVP